jgi:hypothetical protein
MGDDKKVKVTVSNSIYCFGFIGAAVYFIQTAPGFWGGVLGILKAIGWPAFMVYKAFEMLKV